MDAAFLMAGVCGIASLAWWFTGLQKIMSLRDMYFWQDKDILILIFWLSVVADMLVIYRIRARDYETHKIKYGKNFAKKINAAAACDDHVLAILEKTYIQARASGVSLIQPLHLFYNLVGGNGEAANMMVRLGVDHGRLFAKLSRQIDKLPKSGGVPEWSEGLKQVLIAGYKSAYEAEHAAIKPMDLLVGCYDQDKTISEILYDLEIDINKLNNAVAWSRINDKLLNNYKLYKKMARFKPSSNMDRAYTAVATPFLDHFS